MKYSNSIEYNISTKLDKSGLTQLQTQIKQVELTMQQMANRELISASKVQAAREQLQGLSTALTKSFNPSLGMLDLSKFRAELTESKVTAEGLQTAFSLTGAQGSQAFGTLARQIGNFNNGVERTSSTLDKMFVTFSNTFRWGLISSFFSQFMNAIHQSVQYAKDLDDSLTQIMLVTDYSRDSMNEYAKAANEAAKAVGQTTVGMTNASLIFAQQGYDLDQSQQLATLSAKLANASQQDTAATSDQITAYMNAYGLQDDMEALSQAMDNWARIANVSAADVEEIALASQRAASMANAVGVSGEALAAQIATIESVTREAPEQIGNGLKTLYARFSDLKLGKDDEDGIGLGKVTSTLQAIGVQVLDAFGNVRDMDDIMEDLMVVWEDLDDTSKTAAAQVLAGKHQVNRFMALMENSDMYREYLGETGANATGTLEQMNAEYLDSLQGRMTKLQSTLEGLFNDVFTTDMVYPLIDILTKLAEAVDTLFKSVGGGPTIILGLASAFTQLFSQNIARGINDMISNQQIANIRKSNLSNVQGTLEQTGLNNTGVGQYIQAGADRANAMNAEQYRAYKEQLDNYVIAAQNAAAANEKLEDTYLAVGAAAGLAFKDTDLIFKDEESIINTNNLVEQLKEFANNKDIMKQFAAIDFTESIKGAEKFSHSLAVLEDALQRLKNEGENNFDWNLDRAVDSIELTRDALLDLHDAGALTNDEFNEAKNVIEAAFDELAEDGKIEKNATALDNLNVKMARFAEALKHIGPEVLAKGPEAIQAAIQEYIASIEALEGASDTAKGVINNLDMQNLINSVVSAVGALQQLAFGIQSLQNLGSILSDKNISDSERLLKIIINLGTAIPSIVFAFKTLKKASDDLTASISKQAIANAQLSTSETLAAVKSGEITASLGVQTIAIKLATKAVQGLSTALKFLSGPGGALLIAGITAINIILDGLKRKAEEAKEAVQDSINNFNNNYDRTQIDTSNFDKLYEEYKKTGIASDELTEAGKQLAEQLGIVGGSASAASGNFEELAGEISDAKEEALLLADIEANNALNNIVERNESQRKDLSAAWYEDFGQQIDTGNTIVLEDAEAQFFSMDLVQQAGVYREEIKNTNEELDRLNTIRREMANNPEITQSQLDVVDAQIDAAEKRLTNLENNYTTFYGDLDKIINPMAEMQVQSLSAEDFLGLSYEEIVDVLVGPNSNYEWIRDYYYKLGKEEGQVWLDGLIQGSNPEAWAENQLKIVQDQIIQNGPTITADYGAGDYSSSYLGQKEFDQMRNWQDIYGLSDEELIPITELFNWENPTELVNQFAEYAPIIEEALEEGLSGEEIAIQVKTRINPVFEDDMLHYTQEEIDKIFKDAGLEDVSLDEYVRVFAERGGGGIESGEINTLNEEIEDLTRRTEELNEAQRKLRKEGKKGTEEYKNNEKELERLGMELDTAQDRMEQLAIAALETSNGLDALSENWKSINDALQNGNAAEVAGAYAELQGILAQILNVDPSAITQPFMESEETLAALGRLAAGDLSAINDLRAAFADPLSIETYLDTIGFQGDVSEFLKMVDHAQEALPGLEVGASLDDEPFLNALSSMVLSGQIGAEQIQNAFNGIGYNVQVEYVPATYKDVIANVISSGGGLVKGIMAGVRWMVQDGPTVGIPKFHFTKSGGGSGGSTYRGNTGGSNKGGGGGSGSGGKAKTIEPKEKNKHQKDYYEEVDSQLDKIQEELSGIEKQEDRLVGDKARANQAKQIKLLQREKELQEEKLKILKQQEIPDLKTDLKQELADVKKLVASQGIKDIIIPSQHYDKDGIVDNYEEISKAFSDIDDKLVDKYNAAAKKGDEETTNAIDKIRSKISNGGKSILDNIKALNDKQADVKEWENIINDIDDSIADLRIDAYKASMEAIDDFKDIKKKASEFEGYLTGLPTDSPFRALTEDLNYLNNTFEISKKDAQAYYDEIIKKKKQILSVTKDTKVKAEIESSIKYFEGLKKGLNNREFQNGLLGLAMEDLQQLQGWYNGKDAENNPFKGNTAALKEAYEDAYNRVLELAKEHQELNEKIVDDIVDGFGYITEAQDRQMEKYERLDKQLQNYADLYALVNGDDSYKALSELNRQRAIIMQNSLTYYKKYYEQAVADYNEAVKTGNQEYIKEMEDRMHDAEDAWRDMGIQTAETFVEAYKQQVEASNQKIIEDAFGQGNRDFDRLDREWEWQKKYIDKYRDEVEKAYELDKLHAGYMDLLNNAQGASLGTQNKIRKQMEEQLKLLKDQKTVSQYDIDLANAKLLVLEKQIALEDAQRNKNQMQLRRDSQGNYRYVYRADQNDIAKARQELLNAEYDAYELSKKKAMENYEELKDLYKDYLADRKEILEKFNNDEEAAASDLARLTADFNRLIASLMEDSKDASMGLLDSLRWLAENGTDESATAAKKMLETITDEEGNIKTELLDENGQLRTDTEGMYVSMFKFIEDVAEKTPTTTEAANKKSLEAWRKLAEDLEKVTKKLNEDVSSYTSKINETKTATTVLNKETNKLNKDLATQQKNLSSNVSQITEYTKALKSAVDWLSKMRTASEQLAKSTAANGLPWQIDQAKDTSKKNSSGSQNATTNNNTNKNNNTTTNKGNNTTTKNNNTTTNKGNNTTTNNNNTNKNNNTSTNNTKPSTTTNNKLSESKVKAVYDLINSGQQSKIGSYSEREQKAGWKLINLVYPTSLGGSGWSWDKAMKYVLENYDTGGYTGEWGKSGKLAMLHQKELVLNADDTRNILSAVNLVRQLASSLGNSLTDFSQMGFKSGSVNSSLGGVEQRVEIKAEFPNVRDSFEIETALTNLADKAYQYAHRNI